MSEKSGARAEVPILAAGPEATHLASLGSPGRWSRLQKQGCARTGRPGTHSSTLPALGCWASGWLTAPGAQQRATPGVCFGLSLPQWSPQPPSYPGSPPTLPAPAPQRARPSLLLCWSLRTPCMARVGAIPFPLSDPWHLFQFPPPQCPTQVSCPSLGSLLTPTTPFLPELLQGLSTSPDLGKAHSAPGAGPWALLGLICPTRQEQTSSSAHSPLTSVPGGWAPVLPCFRPHEARSASTLPLCTITAPQAPGRRCCQEALLELRGLDTKSSSRLGTQKCSVWKLAPTHSANTCDVPTCAGCSQAGSGTLWGMSPRPALVEPADQGRDSGQLRGQAAAVWPGSTQAPPDSYFPARRGQVAWTRPRGRPFLPWI